MSGAGDPHGDTLTSWKEIAAFFRRDVRTVQRWEREEGLPVYRPSDRRGPVWARRAELEAWWSHASTQTMSGPDERPIPNGASRDSSYRRGFAAVLLTGAVFALVLTFNARSKPAVDSHAVLSVAVDVRPFGHPNVVVPGGVLAVAVTAPETLLAQLDPSTMRAGGAAPRETRWQDFNADGRQELWLYFDVSTLGLPPTATRLAVAGRTRDGRPVAGADNVSVLSRKPD